MGTKSEGLRVVIPVVKAILWLSVQGNPQSNPEGLAIPSNTEKCGG